MCNKRVYKKRRFVYSDGGGEFARIRKEEDHRTISSLCSRNTAKRFSTASPKKNSIATYHSHLSYYVLFFFNVYGGSYACAIRTFWWIFRGIVNSGTLNNEQTINLWSSRDASPSWFDRIGHSRTFDRWLFYEGYQNVRRILTTFGKNGLFIT